MPITLTDDELWQFVGQAHTGIITSLRRDGWPVPLPTWFVALDEKVYFGSPAGAKKLARLRHDDRAAFLVESGLLWRELKAVVLLGRVRFVGEDEAALRGRVDAAMDAKYAAFRTARTELPDATRRHYANARAVLELRPDERVITWDNSKIRMRTATG